MGKVETFVVPTTGTISLAFAPVTGQIIAYDVTAAAAVTVTPVGTVVSGLTAGHTVTITYKYAMTVLQSTTMYGHVQPGGYSGTPLQQVGLVKRGLIYTNCIDMSVDWSKSTSIKLAPNGLITQQDGTGATIDGYVVALPTAEVPFLGLEFSAA